MGDVERKKKIFVVIGMAGSGKTLFCKRMYDWISERHPAISHETGMNPHIHSVNLDPAVESTGMPVNDDIRDAVDYAETMKKHSLGPNGAVTTCLNLYFLRIGELIERIDRADYAIIDTPGQVEAFTWSSPGDVLVQTLKSLADHQLFLLYLVDSFAAHDPGVFMMNMMYAISLSEKFQTEVVAVFNKTDLRCCSEILTWIRDYDAFSKVLSEDDMMHPTYRSMALYFNEFYHGLRTLAVSAKKGFGKSDFIRMFLV